MEPTQIKKQSFNIFVQNLKNNSFLFSKNYKKNTFLIKSFKYAIKIVVFLWKIVMKKYEIITLKKIFT